MFLLLTLTAHIGTIDTSKIVFYGNILGTNIVIRESDLIYWGIAAIIGILAESIVGWRLPFGIVGAILASILGAWLLTDVIPVNIPGTLIVAGLTIPILKILVGAIIVVFLWHAITYPAWSRRHRYYGGYRNDYSRARSRNYRRDYY